MIAAIFSWLFFIYLASTENVYRCSNCGYESNTLPEAPNISTGFLKSESIN